MLCLMFLCLSVVFVCEWPVVLVGLCLGTALSVCEFHHGFSGTFDVIFNNTSTSSLMVFLTFLLCFLAALSTPEEKLSTKYITCISTLCLVLIMCFSSSNLVMFYIFFEVSLIPTVMLILGWGYQPERLQAGTYMMLYTVGASLPLLVILLWQCSWYSTMDVYSLSSVSMPAFGYSVLIILGAFLFKLPIYGAHLWLPKAHVEAPLAGSMILAGILLKLGGFGLYEMSGCFNLYLNNVSICVTALSLWGGFITTLMCMRQVDIKAFVAYSSVGHMSIVVTGFILGSHWGFFSALVTMVAHGLCSSALFSLAFYTYKKSHTRSIMYIKGLMVAYPTLSMWWFLYCCINMACPPTLNLLGELTAVPILWNFSIFMGLVMGLMMFLSAAYNMYLYSALNHGFWSSSVSGGTELKSYSLLSLFLHMVILIIIFKCCIFMLN
uniref:NADH-ubiquinone oxidoreductase chain 4 n=1 Tax=Berthellina sp. TLT-2006 TaxID=407122 RepID=E6Y141_9GAST|nr:NADH dehydrogenase subunit 4 [Berthellina sp. TLT-2006]ABK92227.1 NADH dehydrogenase subunit 4 [Berthellina sp. TLT-2006]